MKEVGLWIDHRKAVIVTVSDLGEETRVMESGMEKHVRFASGSSEDGSSEDIRDRQFANHLRGYYDRVISSIRDADSILILGPGEAKAELETRLQSEGLGERTAAVETVDKMTDREIAARVRQHFLSRSRRVVGK